MRRELLPFAAQFTELFDSASRAKRPARKRSALSGEGTRKSHRAAGHRVGPAYPAVAVDYHESKRLMPGPSGRRRRTAGPCDKGDNTAILRRFPCAEYSQLVTERAPKVTTREHSANPDGTEVRAGGTGEQRALTEL
jgi:hypothetical protein